MIRDEDRRPAAVVLGIIDEPPHGVIFIERAQHLRAHAGQVGLPGGGSDPEDNGDLVRTALREMEEEVGVVPARVEVLASLPIVRARANQYAVTPFVAVVRSGELRIDATETVGVFTVPLQTVIEELRRGTVPIGRFEVETPILDYDGKRIWGVTGYILRSFVDRWNAPDNDLRSLVEPLLL